VSAAALLVLAGTAVPVLAAPVKNIVVVHGAFADGSGWKPVYDILVNDGNNAAVVQEPLTGWRRMSSRLSESLIVILQH
jgi:hypothetical protein